MVERRALILSMVLELEFTLSGNYCTTANARSYSRELRRPKIVRWADFVHYYRYNDKVSTCISDKYWFIIISAIFVSLHLTGDTKPPELFLHGRT